MIDVVFEFEDESFQEEVAALEIEIATKLLLLMDQIGYEVVAYLRDLTPRMRPPARSGEPPRHAHPGGWADVTSNLAGAYRFELYSAGVKVRWSEEGNRLVVNGSLPTQPDFPMELRFINGMDYAAALEARDGYFVLRGITDAGGPVAQAVRAIIPRIDPELEVVIG